MVKKIDSCHQENPDYLVFNQCSTVIQGVPASGRVANQANFTIAGGVQFPILQDIQTSPIKLEAIQYNIFNFPNSQGEFFRIINNTFIFTQNAGIWAVNASISLTMPALSYNGPINDEPNPEGTLTFYSKLIQVQNPEIFPPPPIFGKQTTITYSNYPGNQITQSTGIFRAIQNDTINLCSLLDVTAGNTFTIQIGANINSVSMVQLQNATALVIVDAYPIAPL